MVYVTNKKQFEYLVNWMCEHPAIARGYPRVDLTNSELRSLMEQLTIELNNLGPPVKTLETWRKVWSDYKHTIKRKIRDEFNNEYSVHNFSTRDQRVIDLLELENSVQSKQGMRKTKQGNAKPKYLRRAEVDDDDEDDFNWEETENISDMDASQHNNDSNFNLDYEGANTTSNIDSAENCFEMLDGVSQAPPPLNDSSKSPQINPTMDQNSVASASRKPRLQNLLQKEQPMVNILLRIEKQLARLNETEEENNKLLKLLVYRTTMTNQKKKDDGASADNDK